MRNDFGCAKMGFMETETRLYEAGYFLNGDMNEEEANAAGESIRKIIEDEKGLVIKENKPKKQLLAYPVKKQNTAYLGSLQFIFPFEKITDLKKSLEKTDPLRLLLTQVKQQKETAKVFPKRRLIRRLAQKEFPKEISLGEGAPEKGPVAPASVPELLQVEEIDKKLEEILNQ